MKPKNKRKRLSRRIADYEKMIANGSKDLEVDNRMKTGGFRRPGSNKK